ncbi:MAG: Hydroxyacylglutathione hydrolase [Planctomycetaceae bacterium]|nr:Hydroxyacylglutathione hydrolase [Planctomycetaceae bacterium]
MRPALASCVTLVLLATMWWGSHQVSDPADARWSQIAPGVWRSAGIPAGYAIIEQDRALLIGAPRDMDLNSLKSRGVKEIQHCLLTHHHRDSTARAQQFVKAGIRVRAAKVSAEWLTPEGVRQFWKTSLPIVPPDRAPVLRDRSLGLFAYLMHPEGIDGVECSLDPGQIIQWGAWQIEVLPTPGHSRDHTAFVARKADREQAVIFCGDAISTPGKIWTPYTLDWDHWTDLGTKAAAESLRKIASLKPGLLCPEHAPILAGTDVIAEALNTTVLGLDAAGFLKSYERFSKERLGNPPVYSFLARDQVATAGEKPWTKLSEHLFLSGNTYVLSSRDGDLLVVDPFGPQIAEQITKLQRSEKLGAVKVVLITHAHNDHYTGAFLLPERNKWEVWTLDAVAKPISNPFAVCAPYVDTRALEVDRIFKDGESVTWHEYQFRIGHFPGQTLFTMGVQATIDTKNCYFTADNFFHADQFSGSGGWSGRNRAWPLLYARSAKSVLDAAPDWVLAEHGGAFAFSAEDFRRRVQWSEETARVMDQLSTSTQHRHDWNPTRITVEPMLQRLAADGSLKAELILENPLLRSIDVRVELQDRGLISPFVKEFSIRGGQTLRHELKLKAIQQLPVGRHVFPLIIREASAEDPADAFLVVEN